MNIGIDIDGVLTNLERTMIDYGTKMCVYKHWPININLNEYSVAKAFHWPEEKEEEFWNENWLKYMTQSNPREFAPEIIEKLQQEGHKIYFITARDNYGMPPELHGKTEELTKEWLEKHNIKYEKLIFAQDEEKIHRCFENNIKVMIEDSPSNIEYMSKQIKVIRFDCQYNKEVNNENITTAYSWYHIYQIINEMKGE